ncbi:hypothetical protein PMJ10TS2_33060 [Paenibacillus melissococcoides]
MIRHRVFVLGAVQGEDDIVGADALAGIARLFVGYYGEVDIVAQDEIIF